MSLYYRSSCRCFNPSQKSPGFNPQDECIVFSAQREAPGSKAPGCFIIGLFLFVVIAVSAAVFLKNSKGPHVCFGDVCLKLEVAAKEEERAKGLMLRIGLPADSGMLFVFPGDDRWGFWMKNTLIPLDIIWLDRDKKVADILENVQPYPGESPPTLRPVRQARYALETNAGFVSRHRIKVGDRARFDWIFLLKELKYSLTKQ